MWWLLSLLACTSGPAPAPAPVPAPVEDAGLARRTGHGTVLYADADYLLLRHDNTLGRVVPGDGTYRVGEGVDTSALTPGQHVDIRVDEVEGGAILRAVAVTGSDPLPPQYKPGGWPVTGTVIRVDRSQVMLDHDAIEGFMPAMVMPFRLHSQVGATLSAGQRIAARVIVSGNGYHLVQVRTVGSGDAELRTDIAPIEIGEQLDAVRLPLSSGKSAIVGAGQGKPTALSFIFTTCPDPAACPATIARLQALQPELGNAARIVAVTIDPDIDTLPVLSRYAELVGAEPGVWDFGRLDPIPLNALALRSGLGVTKRDGRITHALRLLILDADGRLIERYDDNAWPLDRVVGQLQTGAPRAAQLGTLTEGR